MKYFYIIERKGMIWEIPYSEQNHQTVLEQFKNGGLIIFKSKNSEKPVTINAVDVTSVLPMDEYRSWTETTNVKQYILNGTWFDAKENKVIRRESWREKELEEREKKELENKEEEKASPETLHKTKERLLNAGILK